MLFRVKQQICLHLGKVRCLASNPSGRYNLRFHIYEKTQKGKNFAIPVNTIEINKQKQSSCEILDNSYSTKTFIMKSDGQVTIDEICIFKIQTKMPIEEEDIIKSRLQLVCEIIQIDYGKEKIAGIFQGRINGYNINECLLIDFYDYCACQLFGTIHSCSYQFQYSPINQQLSTFESFCLTQSNQYVQSLINYLFKQSKKINKKLLQNCENLQVLLGKFQHQKKEIKKQNSEQICEKNQKKQGKIKQLYEIISDKYESVQKLLKKQSDLGNRQTQSCETQPNTQRYQSSPNLLAKKKRKKIFANSHHKLPSYSKDMVTHKVPIDEFETLLHENSLKIYQNWKKYIENLLSVLSSSKNKKQQFITSYSIEYNNKIKQLMGESIIRFKGSWDVDHYSNQNKHRNTMASQLRNMTQQNQYHTNLFMFYNRSFYSLQRPIYFEEGAIVQQNDVNSHKLGRSIKQGEDVHVLFLVHGLGACRLDLEKLKIQLKRCYPNQTRIIISSSNQGRTQGNIDSMGLRLASEVAHYLAKSHGVRKVSFIGHSMGGIIIRSALPRLEKYAKYFYSLITLSSPHIGYNYSNSKLVDAGIWVINNWQKCESIMQLTLSDQQKSEQCFLYKLSEEPGLQWFKKITFVGSYQDLYVPYYSARIQKHHQCLEDNKKKLSKGMTHNQMIDNILNRIKCDITRIDVNFYIGEQNIDNYIGRTAHISFIQNIQMLRIFIMMGRDLIF